MQASLVCVKHFMCFIMSSVNNRSFILFSNLNAFRFFSLPYWMKIPSTI